MITILNIFIYFKMIFNFYIIYFGHILSSAIAPLKSPLPDLTYSFRISYTIFSSRVTFPKFSSGLLPPPYTVNFNFIFLLSLLKRKQKQAKYWHEVQFVLITHEPKACFVVWFVCPVFLHWRKLIFLFSENSICLGGRTYPLPF